MKDFPLEKYRYYIAGNKVIALSTYGGKRVRGVAICHPEDNFDIEVGKKLAAARCNAKVAEKRMIRAGHKLLEAKDILVEATHHANKMTDYYQDSFEAYKKAQADVQHIMNDITGQ